MSGSPLRHRIGQREPIGLFWMTLGSSTVLEVAVQAKPDAVVIDAQHGLWDRASLEQSVGVVASTAPVLVRVAENSPLAIGQALDAGAEGVIVPLIETDEEAAAAVAAARFPPEGTRSGGGVRPLSRDFGQYYLELDPPHRGRRHDRNRARRAQRRGNRQYARRRFRADRHRRSCDLARRLSACRCPAWRSLRQRSAGLQGGGCRVRHLHPQCRCRQCTPQGRLSDRGSRQRHRHRGRADLGAP